MSLVNYWGGSWSGRCLGRRGFLFGFRFLARVWLVRGCRVVFQLFARLNGRHLIPGSLFHWPGIHEDLTLYNILVSSSIFD